MILGFKDQFVSLVEEGSKTHTIRAGNRWKAGMRADLFAQARQRKVFQLRLTAPGCYEQIQVSGMRLLFRAPVVRVEEIDIWLSRDDSLSIAINGAILSRDEADLFAWRDGFRHKRDKVPLLAGCARLMRDFWRETHDIERKPFHGQVIHWDYARRYVPCGDCGIYCCPRLHGREDTYGFFPKRAARV